MIHRTQPPAHYISPSPDELREMAAKVELRSYSPSLATDLANLAAGGEVLPPSVWGPELRVSASDLLGPPDSDGEWRLKTKGGYTSNRLQAVADYAEYRQKYHQNVCDFLHTIEMDAVPGATPLERAMNLLKLLSEKKGGSGGEGGKMLPIFLEESGDAEAGNLNEILDDVERLDSLEEKLLERDTDSSTAAESDETLKKMSLAQDMMRGKDIWLKVSRNLDKLAKMNVAKSRKFVKDLEGEEVRNRPIESFSELPKLIASEWALPNAVRLMRVATRASMVRERGKYEEKQQLLYILIDCSGSMTGTRIHKAGGVLMNRLKAVVAGDAHVYVRFFATRCYAEHFAETPTEARKLIRLFENENFNGGGTQIAKCARTAQRRIEALLTEKKVLNRPELVIVTDGEDDVSSLKMEDFTPTKVHAFVVERSNSALIQFAKATGGVGIEKL